LHGNPYSKGMINKLNFGIGNAKLAKDTAILSLPAGHSCPFAKDCRSCAHPETGKIQDGAQTQFRCYAANVEALFRNVRESRWENFEAVKEAKTTLEIAALIDRSIPIRNGKIKMVRIHQAGDFFSQTYFDAWLLVARQHPDLIFYGYTKALPLWVKRIDEIPTNFKLVASRGGTHDHLIEEYGLRSVRVVLSEREAKRKWKLPIDHDDSHVWNYKGDFSIVIHGTQIKNTKASKAWYKIIKKGKGGYKTDYFGHYKKHGKTVHKMVNGKKIHVKPKSGTITVNGIHINPTKLNHMKSFLKQGTKVNV
jgi:hypothetical protein